MLTYDELVNELGGLTDNRRYHIVGTLLSVTYNPDGLWDLWDGSEYLTTNDRKGIALCVFRYLVGETL